jgi:hypothetical protein
MELLAIKIVDSQLKIDYRVCKLPENALRRALSVKSLFQSFQKTPSLVFELEGLRLICRFIGELRALIEAILEV